MNNMELGKPEWIDREQRKIDEIKRAAEQKALEARIKELTEQIQRCENRELYRLREIAKAAEELLRSPNPSPTTSLKKIDLAMAIRLWKEDR